MNRDGDKQSRDPTMSVPIDWDVTSHENTNVANSLLLLATSFDPGIGIARTLRSFSVRRPLFGQVKHV